jgi:ATP/maltotriose-dependent transcriptional regulator MalT
VVGAARCCLGDASEDAAGWAFADGRWDDALSIADELIVAADAGHPHYTDALMLSIRASIRFARGDVAGADADIERAAELARGSDVQAQSQAFCVRAILAIAAKRGDEAEPAEGQQAAADEQVERALSFYREAAAATYLRRGGELLAASA